MAQSKPDLISRQELLALIRDHADKIKADSPLQHAVLAYWLTVVEALPAKAVLVDLVHCQDCEHWKAEEGQTFGKCKNWSVDELPGILRAVTHMTGPDDFCSDARRRSTGGIDIRG